jgi:hypothetical protein
MKQHYEALKRYKYDHTELEETIKYLDSIKGKTIPEMKYNALLAVSNISKKEYYKLPLLYLAVNDINTVLGQLERITEVIPATSYSTGTYTPETLVQMLKDMGLKFPERELRGVTIDIETENDSVYNLITYVDRNVISYITFYFVDEKISDGVSIMKTYVSLASRSITTKGFVKGRKEMNKRLRRKLIEYKKIIVEDMIHRLKLYYTSKSYVKHVSKLESMLTTLHYDAPTLPELKKDIDRSFLGIGVYDVKDKRGRVTKNEAMARMDLTYSVGSKSLSRVIGGLEEGFFGRDTIVKAGVVFNVPEVFISSTTFNDEHNSIPDDTLPYAYVMANSIVTFIEKVNSVSKVTVTNDDDYREACYGAVEKFLDDRLCGGIVDAIDVKDNQFPIIANINSETLDYVVITIENSRRSVELRSIDIGNDFRSIWTTGEVARELSYSLFYEPKLGVAKDGREMYSKEYVSSAVAALSDDSSDISIDIVGIDRTCGMRMN